MRHVYDYREDMDYTSAFLTMIPPARRNWGMQVFNSTDNCQTLSVVLHCEGAERRNLAPL